MTARKGHSTSADRTPQRPPAPTTLVDMLKEVPRCEVRKPFLEVEQVSRFSWKSRVAREERWDVEGQKWKVEHFGPRSTRLPSRGMMEVGGNPYWFSGLTRERALRKARKWLKSYEDARQKEAERERVEP